MNTRPRLSWTVALASLLVGMPRVEAAEAARRKMLIISVDGTRPDALRAARTPHLDALFARGAFSYRAQAAVPEEDLPVSGSSYSSMLTGVWCAKHRCCENSFSGARYDRYPIFFCRLKDAVCHSIVRWEPLDSNLIACADVHLAPSGDAEATEEAVRLLTESDPDVLFFHLEDVDTAGHAHGFSPSSAGYLEAIERSDARVGEVLDALRARPRYGEEEWLILALSDHGGAGRDHHAKIPECQTVFWVMDGPGVLPGEIDPPPQVVDVAPTALEYFGIEIDPAWDLDGHGVGLQAEPPLPRQRPADCSQDGQLDLADAICLLGVLFSGKPLILPCGDGTLEGENLLLLDANGDASLDISDPVYLLLYLFAEGPPPVLGDHCVPLPTCPDACLQ